MSSELRHAACDVLEYLKDMGIDHIPVRLSDIRRAVQPKASAPPPVPVVMNPVSPEKHDDKKTALMSLQKEIGDCMLCGLSDKRNNVVFGEGNPEARIMFIGEAPGREEDLQARPFVGEAGRQLTNLIGKILGLQREDVYIANICKCRPPENRDPVPGEIDACFPFINRQIRIIRPGIIIALGKIASYSLMKPDYPILKFSILRERGKLFYYEGAPVMPTTHPAYWLRNGKDKHKVVEDIRTALKKLTEDMQ
jgi:uracil-DNA glycosylase